MNAMRIVYGRIVEQDFSESPHLYRIQITTGQLSAWLPKIDLVSGDTVSNHPFSVDTQVVAFFDGNEGFIVGSLNSREKPAVSDRDTLKRIVFSDGAVIEYDAENHQLNAILPSGATSHLTSDGGITVDGDTTVNGDVAINGNLTVSGDTAIGGNLALAGNGVCGGNFAISGICSVGGLAAVGGGAVSATGGMNMSGGDVLVDGVSVKSHTHAETGDGGGTTGTPQ